MDYDIIFKLISWAFSIYYILIFAYILLSWLPQLQQSPIGLLLGRLVEPYLALFRKWIPPIGVLDLSPVVALIALNFIQRGFFVLLRWIIKLVS